MQIDKHSSPLHYLDRCRGIYLKNIFPLFWQLFVLFGKKSTSQSHSVSVDKSKVSVFWVNKTMKQNSNSKKKIKQAVISLQGIANESLFWIKIYILIFFLDPS